MHDVARRDTYLGEERVKGHQDSEHSRGQQSLSKAHMHAVECGTILLDLNQVEKETPKNTVWLSTVA